MRPETSSVDGIPPSPPPWDGRRVLARIIQTDEASFLRLAKQPSERDAEVLAFLTHALFESEKARTLTSEDRQVLYGLVPARPAERRRVLLSLALDPGVLAVAGPLPAEKSEHLLKERTRIFVAFPDGEPFCLELLLASGRPIRRGPPKSKEGFSFSDVDEQLRRRALVAVFAREREWGSTMPPRRFLQHLRAEYDRLGRSLPAEVTASGLNNELKWAVQKQLADAKSYQQRTPGYHPSKLPEDRPA